MSENVSVPAVPPPITDEQINELLSGTIGSQEPRASPYPATTKQAAEEIDGVSTSITAIYFSDKILMTISQNGKLGQWFHVPLENTNPGNDGYHILPDPQDDGLLPLANLTATTILGPRGSDHETNGQLYARQIASALATKNPDEKRLLVVGLGIESSEIDPDLFFKIIDLALQCL